MIKAGKNQIEGSDDILSGAYVLNSLTDAERRAFEQRMETSEDLRNEVTELADTAVLLGMATEPVQPSPDLRASVLAAVGTLPQLPPGQTASRAGSQLAADEPRDAADPAPAASVGEPGGRPAPRGGAEARAAERWMRRPVNLIVAFAAGLALLFGGMVLGRLLTGPSPEQQHAAVFAELNAAPDLQRIGAEVEGAGTVTLVVSQRLDRSALVWESMPELSEDKVYELWYITDTPIPAGIIEADTPQNFRVLDGRLPEGASVGVTVEPEGGSEQPTTEPIVVLPTTAA